MACNMYRALLNEYANADIDGIGKQAKLLRHGIGYAPTFSALGMDEYLKLDDWCRRASTEVSAMEADPDFEDSDRRLRKMYLRDELREIIMTILPKIGKEWLDFGMPETSESWMERKYGGNDEN